MSAFKWVFISFLVLMVCINVLLGARYLSLMAQENGKEMPLYDVIVQALPFKNLIPQEMVVFTNKIPSIKKIQIGDKKELMAMINDWGITTTGGIIDSEATFNKIVVRLEPMTSIDKAPHKTIYAANIEGGLRKIPTAMVNKVLPNGDIFKVADGSGNITMNGYVDTRTGGELWVWIYVSESMLKSIGQITSKSSEKNKIASEIISRQLAKMLFYQSSFYAEQERELSVEQKFGFSDDQMGQRIIRWERKDGFFAPIKITLQ